MTTLKLKYGVSILIILIHFFGCKQSWDHRIQQDFMNLFQVEKYFELQNAYIDHEDQIWHASELEIKAHHLLSAFNKNEESNLVIVRLLKKHKTEIKSARLISQFDKTTMNFVDMHIQFE